MKNILTITAVALALLFASCSKKEQKRRGLDFDELKQELALNDEQEVKFDELTTDIKQALEENRNANMSEGGKMNRTAFFAEMEEIYKKQDVVISEFLDEDQLVKYHEFMEKNTRKRPRYNDELLTQIKTELELDDEQAKVLEAANNAFEKEFQDAHDIYHGSSDLAKEYWDKFDTQRKAAIESVLNEEQIESFRELVKDVQPANRR